MSHPQRTLIEAAENVFLNETLDTILPHTVTRNEPMASNPAVHVIHHVIRVPGGQKIKVKSRITPGFPTYDELGSKEKPKNELIVKFEGEDGNMALTGKHKNSLPILGTVGHIVRKIRDDTKYNVGNVSWTPVSSEGGEQGNKEKAKRNRVYARIAGRMGHPIPPGAETVTV